MFNATSGGSPEQIRYLVFQGVISPLCDLLDCSDSKTVIVCLEALENILKVGQIESCRHEGENHNSCEHLASIPKGQSNHNAHAIVAVNGDSKVSDSRDVFRNIYAQFIEECGGLDRLELIQYHENIDVYCRVSGILKNYFDADEQGEEESDESIHCRQPIS